MYCIHFLCLLVCGATNSWAGSHLPSVISVPKPIDIAQSAESDADNEVMRSEEADQLAIKIAEHEQYLALLGINKSSIDPDIIQETFMTTVILLQSTSFFCLFLF